MKTLSPAIKQEKQKRLYSQKAGNILSGKNINKYLKQLHRSGTSSGIPAYKFKKTIENSPLPILITKNADPTIDYVNPAWERTTGYTLNEVKGKNPNILRSSKTPDNIYPKLWKELINGKPFKSEMIFNSRKDGQIYQMSSTMYPVFKNGKIAFYVQIEHDITKRKKREKYQKVLTGISLLLAQAKTKEQAIPKFLKNLCSIGDWELGELWLLNEKQDALIFQGLWNAGSLDTRELRSENKKVIFPRSKGLPGRVLATGKPTWTVYSPNKNKYFPARLLAAKFGLNTALAFPLFVNHRTIGALTFFTSINKKPDQDMLRIMTSLGNHLGQFLEHKRTEELLADLRKQNELILNNAGEGIYGLDKNGIITFVNPAAARILGWKRNLLIGKSFHELVCPDQPENAPSQTKGTCSIPKVLENPHTPCVTTETYWRNNGTAFPVESVYTPIIDNDVVVGFVVVFKDITEWKKVEDMKKEFLSIAAHELKTPITTLKLLSQYQLRNIEKFGKEKIRTEDLILIDKELDRLTRIINDILDDQRIETGKLQLRVEKTDLSQIIENTVKQMSMLSPVHKLAIENNKKAFILADSDRIAQVLTNLISNSIKYSPESTTITINTKIEKDQVTVSVVDQGKGIPEEKQKQIFNRFYQVMEGKSAGFGLGLYISKQIIERHQGKIWVNSQEGKGSTFYFSLALIPFIDNTTHYS